MAKTTSSKPRSKTLPSYMKRMAKDGSTTSAVSARVDTDLKDRFHGAVDLAKAHHIELSITEVIRDAMIRACSDIEKYTGKLIGEVELPLDAPAEDKPKV